METPFEDLAELIKDIPDELLASSLVRLAKATVSSDNKRDYASISADIVIDNVKHPPHVFLAILVVSMVNQSMRLAYMLGRDHIFARDLFEAFAVSFLPVFTPEAFEANSGLWIMAMNEASKAKK